MSEISSRNALRHGLTSKIHLLPEDQADYDFIHQELLDTFSPETKDELLILADMAHSRVCASRAHRIINLNIEEEARLLPKVMNSKAHDAFLGLLEQFPARPEIVHKSMMQNIFGIEHLIAIVEKAHKSLTKPRPSISIRMMHELIRAIGSRAEIDLSTPEAFDLMVLFFAQLPNPSDLIAQWEKTATNFENPMGPRLLKEALADHPDRKKARADLTARIGEHLEKLRAAHAKFSEEWNLQISRSVEINFGMGLGDPDRANQSKLMHRYATTNSNRFDRLADRLRSQIRQRLRQAELKRKAELAEAEKEKKSQQMQINNRFGSYMQPIDNGKPVTTNFSKKGLYPGLLKKLELYFEVRQSGDDVEYVKGVQIGEYAFTDSRKIRKCNDLSMHQMYLIGNFVDMLKKIPTFYQLEPPAIAGKMGEEISDIGFERLCDESSVLTESLKRVIQMRATYESQLGRRLTRAEADELIVQYKTMQMIEASINSADPDLITA
jgi:hypothetical protein